MRSSATTPEIPVLILAAAALAADPDHLYVGVSTPLVAGGYSSTSGFVGVFDAAPVNLELRVAKRWGLRLDTDVAFVGSADGLRYDGLRARLEAPHYFGASAASEGMRGFYLGPWAGAGFDPDAVVPQGGVALGYSGRISDRLRWRAGGWAGVAVSPDGPQLVAGVVLEMGGFVF